MCAGLADKEACAVVSVYQNIGQTVFYHKVEQFFCWFGVRPSVFVAMGNHQPSLLCRRFEAFVVVCIAATAILNAVDVVVIVNHFVKKSGAYILYWSTQSASTYVDFVSAADSRYPCIIVECEVSVSSRCALNGDGRS